MLRLAVACRLPFCLSVLLRRCTIWLMALPSPCLAMLISGARSSLPALFAALGAPPPADVGQVIGLAMGGHALDLLMILTWAHILAMAHVGPRLMAQQVELATYIVRGALPGAPLRRRDVHAAGRCRGHASSLPRDDVVGDLVSDRERLLVIANVTYIDGMVFPRLKLRRGP